ncbi:hypothetical protein Goarm_005713 [Gossypium armourianum]|uniref:RNase H type-1 domain-containing protein n=1 Tax=Gossypium armourianum TaxID=34283 RepID=A0A7J9KEJ2_9ROSI|nr:hypothetical protein [Gossypium armourianum]
MTWNSKDELWKIPRKFQKPQRIRLFIWMVLKDPLLTNVKHARRGLGDNSAYGICDHNFEDFFHVIRDCSTTKAIWAQVPWSIDEVFKSSLCWVKRFASLVLTGNWIQMYTDGTVKANFGFVTAGGVICDHNGKWILGFNRYLGMCLVLEAEWAIYDGLDLTLDQGHDKVLINTNSMEVVWAIQDMHSKDSNSTLIR